MEIEKFITSFASQFEATDASVFSAETKFREIEEWSSMISLSLIAMADDEYNVKLTGEDIRTSSTVEDIYKIINSRMA